MHRDRTASRAWALQVLYRWELGPEGESVMQALESTLATRRVSPGRVEYLRALLGALEDAMEAIDRSLEDALDNWRLERLSVVDRSVLRIGATELLELPEMVPAPVAIQEGVRLAERYGGPDSPRFVNGVLDAVHRAAGGA